MQLLNEYNQKRQELFDYFGYEENWRVFPVDDATMYYWRLHGENFGNEDYDNEVLFADTLEELEAESGNFYSNEIYTQRHLPKWVYRGADYTMVVVDTHTDGNKFLQIFDNAKEIKA